MREYDFRPDNDCAMAFSVPDDVHWHGAAYRLLGNSNSNYALLFTKDEFAGFVSRGKFPYLIWRPNRAVHFFDGNLQEAVNFTREMLQENRIYTLLLSSAGMCVDYLAPQSSPRKFGKTAWNSGSGRSRFHGISHWSTISNEGDFLDEDKILIGAVRNGAYEYRGIHTDPMFRHDKWIPPGDIELEQIINQPWK